MKKKKLKSTKVYGNGIKMNLPTTGKSSRFPSIIISNKIGRTFLSALIYLLFEGATEKRCNYENNKINI